MFWDWLDHPGQVFRARLQPQICEAHGAHTAAKEPLQEEAGRVAWVYNGAIPVVEWRR